MKFHNTLGNGYAFRMNPAVSRTMLARLRASTRLAALVLLLFALKIGVATACVKDDFADRGFGANSQHGTMLKVSGTDESDDLRKGSITRAGACSHCSCHQAAAIVPDATIAPVLGPQALRII